MGLSVFVARERALLEQSFLRPLVQPPVTTTLLAVVPPKRQPLIAQPQQRADLPRFL